MPGLIDLLHKNKMTLIVALQEYNPEIIETAVLAGADALQLPISAEIFKNAKEKAKLADFLGKLKLPVGLAIDSKESLTAKTAEAIVKVGFDFINAGIEHLSPVLLKIKGISKILELNSRYSLDEITLLSSDTFQALDAAILSTAEQGKNLVVGDLQNYISIVLSSGLPVIIPTQRDVRPSEVAILSDTGARGLLLTPVVTGTTAGHIGKAVREYRIAVDDLA